MGKFCVTVSLLEAEEREERWKCIQNYSGRILSSHGKDLEYIFCKPNEMHINSMVTQVKAQF